MVNPVEFKQYLTEQYLRIQKKVLGDQGIEILRTLDNKEFMIRRVSEIFERTFNSQREHLIQELIKQNNALKERINNKLQQQEDKLQPEQLIQSPIIDKLQEIHSMHALEKIKLLKRNEELTQQIKALEKQQSVMCQHLKKEVNRLESLLSKQKEKNSQQLALHLQKQKNEEIEHQKLLQQNREVSNSNLQLNLELQRIKRKEVNYKNQIQLLRKRVSKIQGELKEAQIQFHSLHDKQKQLMGQLVKKTKQIEYFQERYEELNKSRLSQFSQQSLTFVQTSNKKNQKEDSPIKKQQYTSSKFTTLELQMKNDRITKLEKDILVAEKQRDEKIQEAEGYKKLYESLAKEEQKNYIMREKYETQIRQIKQNLVQKDSIIESIANTEQIKSKKKIQQEKNIWQMKKFHEIIQLKEKYEKELQACQKTITKKQQDNRNLMGEILQLTNKMQICQKQVQYLKQQKKGTQIRENSMRQEHKKQLELLDTTIKLLTKMNQEKKKLIQQQVYTIQQLTLKIHDLQIHIQKDQSYHNIEEIKKKNNKSLTELKSQISQSHKKCINLQSQIMKLQEQKHQYKEMHNVLKVKILDLQTLILKKQQKINKLKQQNQIESEQHAKVVTEIISKYQKQYLSMKKIFQRQLSYEQNKMYQNRIKQQENLLELNKTDKKIENEWFDIYKIQKLDYHAVRNTQSYKQQNQYRNIEPVSVPQSTQQQHIQENISLIKKYHTNETQKLNKTIDNLKQQLEKEQLKINKQKVKLQKSLHLLASYQEESTLYRTKFFEFKSETFSAMNIVLGNFKKELLQIINYVQTQRNQIRNWIGKQLIVLIGSHIRKTLESIQKQYRQKLQKQQNEMIKQYQQKIKQLKEQYQKKLKEKSLDNLAAVSHKQFELNEIIKRQKIILEELEKCKIEIKNKDSYLVNEEKTRDELSKIISNFQLKNKSLKEELNQCKERQNRNREYLQKQQERIKKVQKNCQEKIQKLHQKYSKENQLLFNRYEKQFQKLVMNGGKDTLKFYSPSIQKKQSYIKSTLNKKDQLLQTLQKEIKDQRRKLQQIKK